MSRPSDWWVLDLDSDPTPGDPESVRRLATQFTDFADDVELAEGQVNGLGGDSAVLSWIGLSGDAFRDEVGELPEELRKLHTSYRMAGEALDTFAPELSGAQDQADRALASGREARGRLTAAQGQLSGAEDWAARASSAVNRYDDSPAGAPPPDPEQVRSATRNYDAAQARVAAVEGQVRDAQGDLDAARQLALDAKELRQSAARTAKDRIDEASDAGIQNQPWWSWDNITGFVSDAWDFLVSACKIIVLVLGIVVLIIGGPLAWIVLAAALIVLADTLMKYARGEATLWDVAFAALDCIPGAKGLTTAADLAAGVSKLARGGLPELAALGRRGLSAAGHALTTAGPRLRSMAGDVRSAVNVFLDMRASNLGNIPLVARESVVRGLAALPGGGMAMMSSTVTDMVRPLGATVRANTDALAHAVDTFGSMRTAQIVRNADGSYDAVLRYNSGWDDVQRLGADAKADALTNADTVFDVGGAAGRDPNIVATWRNQNPVGSTADTNFATGSFDANYHYDADHIQDLQLSGLDDAENLWYLDRSVNRSAGPQIDGLIRRSGMTNGAVINTFRFQDRGIGAIDVLRGGSYLYTPPAQ